ncbi:MAG TPA: hypothetical protein VJ836_02780 [Candidatus Saccharimonadales bacterium]|nr:hypothetical protein [Candidatus Saccharimonadales bacterium]
MNDPERLSQDMPVGEIPAPINSGDQRVDPYIAPKVMGGITVGLTLLANAESIVARWNDSTLWETFWETASTYTMQAAGITAVGAAAGVLSVSYFERRYGSSSDNQTR